MHAVRASDRGSVVCSGRQNATKQPLCVGTTHDAADTRETVRMAGNGTGAHAMHCRAADVLHSVHVAAETRQIGRMQPSRWVQNATKYVPRKAVWHMQQQQKQAKGCLACGHSKWEAGK